MKKLFILAALLPLAGCRPTGPIKVAGFLQVVSPISTNRVPGYTETTIIDTLDGEYYHKLFAVVVKTDSFDFWAKGKTTSMDMPPSVRVKGLLKLGADDTLVCKRDYALESEDPDENPPR